VRGRSGSFDVAARIWPRCWSGGRSSSLQLEVVDADAAWASVFDDAGELADARSLRRQTDALRRALADLDGQIVAARDRA
jgi:hypothetical protein